MGCDFVSAQSELNDANLPDYLEKLGFVSADEPVQVEKAGDGNINWVRRARVREGGRSWIVKQARPRLERFPEYEASTERIVFEARYYARVRALDSDGICPEILHFDECERVLVIEDLGDVDRLDRRLEGGWDASGAAASLAGFLARVHRETRDADLARHFANDGMRRLHGDHIFVLPFAPNDFPLAPGLVPRAQALWADAEIGSIAAAAYARYLEPRGSLVHGDVQAGNVLLAPGGPKLLDAEIAHVGDPAFDLGTLVAHLVLPAVASGETSRALPAVEAAWSAYGDAHGEDPPSFRAVARYAAIEMLRRTLGAARVRPVEPEAAALAVVDAAEAWMRRPPETPYALLA